MGNVKGDVSIKKQSNMGPVYIQASGKVSWVVSGWSDSFGNDIKVGKVFERKMED